MIISHSRRFIFVHTRKTAGSSIGISLMRYCEPGDVVRGYISGGMAQGVYPPEFDEAARVLRVAKRVHALRHVPDVFRRLSDPQILQRVRDALRVALYREYVAEAYGVRNTHLTAAQTRELVGLDIWKGYRKFAFVRDPWDRMISFYRWRTRRNRHAPSFRQFVEAICSNDARRMRLLNAHGFDNAPFYAIENEMVLDLVGHYENLQEDLGRILKACGVDYDGWLPHNKRGFRQERDDEARYYSDDATIEMVGNISRDECERFGYRWENSPANLNAARKGTE